MLERIATAIEALTVRVGRAASWLYPALVLVLIGNVALRYGLGRGSIALEELQWHLYATAFLLGVAWTSAADQHVRVDVLAVRLTRRARAGIETAGSLLLLLPFTLIGAWWGFDFVRRSWIFGERSEMPSGLPARWVIKGALFLAFVLLAAQALATAARSLRRWLEAEAEPPP